MLFDCCFEEEGHSKTDIYTRVNALIELENEERRKAREEKRRKLEREKAAHRSRGLQLELSHDWSIVQGEISRELKYCSNSISGAIRRPVSISSMEELGAETREEGEEEVSAAAARERVSMLPHGSIRALACFNIDIEKERERAIVEHQENKEKEQLHFPIVILLMLFSVICFRCLPEADVVNLLKSACHLTTCVGSS